VHSSGRELLEFNYSGLNRREASVILRHKTIRTVNFRLLPSRNPPDRISLPLRKGIIWTLAACLFLALLGLHREIGLIAGCSMIFALSLDMDRDKLWAWPVAMAISWTWVYLNRHFYFGYNAFTISILGVSVLPILAWPSLLMLFYLWVFPLFPVRNGWRLWAQLSGTLAALMIVMEVLGYHLFGIHLDAGRGYPGWPVLDIFHCPWWMTACYFWNGLVFCAYISLVTCRERNSIRAPGPECLALEPARSDPAA
jgi:hypothetical protein